MLMMGNPCLLGNNIEMADGKQVSRSNARLPNVKPNTKPETLHDAPKKPNIDL